MQQLVLAKSSAKASKCLRSPICSARSRGAPIVDGTGLTGFWDLNLSVSYEGLIGPSVASDPTLVFTTLQEQLGLRLDPRRGPVDTFVIDRIEARRRTNWRPSESLSAVESGRGSPSPAQ